MRFLFPITFTMACGVLALGSVVARAAERPEGPVAPAAAAAPSTSTAPRSLAVGVATIKEHGFGVFGRARMAHVALDLSAGAMPVLLMLQTPDGTAIDFKYDTALHADASAVIFFLDETRRWQPAMRLGGAYDSILGPGIVMGAVLDMSWTQMFIEFGAGVQVYPQYEDRVKEHFGVTAASADNPTAVAQPYIGVSFGWYCL